MPTTVKIRRSGTASATPSSLEHGEIAINYADGKVFWKNASNVITSFTFQAYALASHTHAASDITSGTLDIARIPTGSTSSTVCVGNDARLSDTRTPTDNTVSTAKIQNDAVTYAKIQNVSATDRLLGRSSAGAGDVEEITCTSFGRSLIDDADAAAARTTLSVQPTASPAFTGAATVTSGSVSVSGSVGSAPANGTAHTLVLTSTATAAVNVGPAVFFKGQTGNNTADYGFGAIQGVKDSSSSQNYAGALVFFAQTGGGAASLSEVMRCRTDASTGAVQTVMAGQLLVTAGSGTSPNYAPGIAFTNDTNTGIHQVSGNSDTLSIVTGGSERMRVDASGNVGIGLTPTQRLHVARSGSGIAARFTDNATQTLDIGITASAGVYYDNPNSGYHEWQIGGSGKMRLTGGAELLIGTATDNGAYLLQVNSQIYATNATIATSDARFKTRVESLTDATSVIESLRPVAFDFIPQTDRNFATERQVGLIAQEAQSALAGTDYADSVVAQCGDHLGLAYEKLVPVLIKALQESNARIAALEERINA